MSWSAVAAHVDERDVREHSLGSALPLPSAHELDRVLEFFGCREWQIDRRLGPLPVHARRSEVQIAGAIPRVDNGLLAGF